MNIPPTAPGSQTSAPYDTGKFLLTTRLLHFALVLGLVLFGVIALVISARQMSLTPALNNPLIAVSGLGCIISIGASFLTFSIFRRNTAAPANIRSAIQQYQAYCLTRWAVIEGGALFSAVVFIITKNVLPLGLFLISTLFLLSRYPSLKEFLAFTGDRKN